MVDSSCDKSVRFLDRAALFADDTSVDEANGAVGDLCEVFVVGDDDEGVAEPIA